MTNLIGDSENIKGLFLELREKLDGNDTKQRKEAAKRVVSLMRAGEDCSILFSSMLRSIQTDDIELKRLVYIYILTYSNAQEEQSIMAVSAMIKDSEHYNPFIRALAIRSMSRIKIEAFAENIVTQVKKALSDKDAYVRKTAALGVAKIFNIIPDTVEGIDIYKSLIGLLQDENPLVISNAVAAICEINAQRSSPILTLDSNNIVFILNAFINSTEWCQINLLDALALYTPESSHDAHNLIERLLVYMKSNNPAITIGAFKCIFIYLEYDIHDNVEVLKKCLPPLLDLVSSSDSEIQFVVLRTLSLFCQKYPTVLSGSIQIFYCKYNDPSYIKVEKLEIISTIVKSDTLGTTLDELQEYCNDIDVQFSRKAIRTLAQIALKYENAANKCVDILVELMKGKADYAIEQSIIVMPDIFRKYPRRFDGIIATICQTSDQIKSSEAKSAFIWILGEYCSTIENVDLILDPYLDNFGDENSFVQLAILTALIKSYIVNPEASKDQLQYVLEACQKDNILPDVKNKAMIYWRLLSNNQQDAKFVIDVPKTLTQDKSRYSDEVLNTLISNIGSVSGVLHIVPSRFTNSEVYLAIQDHTKIELKDIQTNGLLSIKAAISPTKVIMKITNVSGQRLSEFAIAANKNPYGLVIEKYSGFQESLHPNEEMEIAIPYTLHPDAFAKSESNSIQFAIRTNLGNVVFAVPFDPLLAMEKYAPKKNEFLEMWADLLDGCPFSFSNAEEPSNDVLFKRHIYVIARAEGKIACGLKICNKIVLCEVTKIDDGFTGNLEGDALPCYIVSRHARELFSC